MYFHAVRIPWSYRNGQTISKRNILHRFETITHEEAERIRAAGELVASRDGEEQWAIRYPDQRCDIVFSICTEPTDHA